MRAFRGGDGYDYFMVRNFLALMLLASQLAVASVAYCRPPDQVVNSPIPPLKEPAPRRATRPVAKAPNVDRTLPPLPPQQPAGAKPQADVATKDNARRPDDYLTQQTDIWNSPVMREARQLVIEFSRRSAQTSPREGEQFLDQLSKLPPAEMQSWLRRYLERRNKIALEREVEQFARQLMVERALNRQEAMRQAFAHVSQLRAEAAAAMQMRRQTLAGQANGYPEDSQLLDLGPVYHPLDATTDPMNPRGYARRVAGAMTLPGDLPRDDPRNFIEGEEGIDTGEWATSPDAQPPVEE